MEPLASLRRNSGVPSSEKRREAAADVKTGVEEAPPRLDLERAVRRACDAG